MVQGTQKLSAQDRLTLIQTLNALPGPQFDELVFALSPPKQNVPSNAAPQGDRTIALLTWAESPIGSGLPALEKILGQIIGKETQTAEEFLSFAIAGNLGDMNPAELQAIVELIRKKTGDDSIDIAFFREGSIKLILSGSPDGLNKLQELFESGELENLPIPPVENVESVDNDSTDARKARLVQSLRLPRAKLFDTHDYNLSNADLSGTNLKDINLRGANLTNVDLTNANVSGAVFGNNQGLTEANEQDLKSRGAFFITPSDLEDRSTPITHIIAFSSLPKPVKAELLVLQKRLETSTSSSTWMIQIQIFQECLRLLWFFNIHILIENLFIPSSDREIDD